MAGPRMEVNNWAISTIMKQALVLATLIVAVYCGEWEPGLRVRFNYYLPFGFGTSMFYNIPRNESDAVNTGWTQQTRPKDGYVPSLTVMYCANPPVMCAMYDDNNYVAGLQFAVAQSNFSDNPFDLAVQGWTEWTDSKGDKYWTNKQFYVSEEYLAIDKEKRLASRASNKLYQQNSIWVPGMGNKLYTVPNNTVDIANTNFTKQGCVPWMGLHYYYNMSTATACTADAHLPWSPLYDDGTLVGISCTVFGRLTITEGVRNWYERPPWLATKLAVPRAPECVYDMAKDPGVLGIHTYFVEDPRYILCLNN